jgi:hypothetical protein
MQENPQTGTVTGSGVKKLALVAVLSGWLFLVAFLMIFARSVSLELFFVLWLIGMLILLELSQGRYASPSYQTRMKYIAAVGVVLFSIIIAGKVLEILSR